MTRAEHVSGARRLSTRAWFQVILGAMILTVLVGAAIAAQVISVASAATSRLVDHSLPAQQRALQFQNTLLNQETGVRGFAITGDRQFLEPYNDGIAAEHQAAQSLRELLDSASGPSVADLDGIENAVAQWRTTYAQPLIASPAARTQSDATAAQGKQLFDHLRTLFDAQNQHLADAVRTDTDRLEHARTVRDAVLIALLVAYLATGLALAVLVNRLIDRPLRYLTESSLRVAAGDFGYHIDAHGPADLVAVATAVEDMRRRIVDELDASHAQEAQLQQQKVFLDSQTIELRRSNAELEQFAYVASHDLQEPLRKIAAFCQLLEKRYSGQLDERATQYIDFAVDGAKRMQILINDLLTFSRVGRMSDGTATVDLAATIDHARRNLANTIEDTGAEVIRPETLPRITGEATLLTMLWQNLISNAVKFRAPDRPPQIRIEAEPDGAGWRFTVQDNGIGIAPEFAEKVFVIFQRLHGRAEYEGTGIGLALAKKIVEHHDGRIWIDTDYTGGTRVCFTLVGVPPLPAVSDEIETDNAAPRLEGITR